MAAGIRLSRAGGLMIASHPFFLSQIDRLAALTVRSAVPTISQYRELATADSLISCQQKQRPQPFQPFSSRAVIRSQWDSSLVGTGRAATSRGLCS